MAYDIMGGRHDVTFLYIISFRYIIKLFSFQDNMMMLISFDIFVFLDWISLWGPQMENVGGFKVCC